MPLFFTEVWYKPRTVIKTRWHETEGSWPLLKKSRTFFKPRTVVRICGRLPRNVNWSHLFGWLSRNNSGFLVRLTLIVRAFVPSRIVSYYKEVVIYIEVQLNGGKKAHILSIYCRGFNPHLELRRLRDAEVMSAHNWPLHPWVLSIPLVRASDKCTEGRGFDVHLQPRIFCLAHLVSFSLIIHYHVLEIGLFGKCVFNSFSNNWLIKKLLLYICLEFILTWLAPQVAWTICRRGQHRSSDKTKHTFRTTKTVCYIVYIVKKIIWCDKGIARVCILTPNKQLSLEGPVYMEVGDPRKVR